MNFEQLMPYDENGIKEMSKMATAIVREHFDPIIGKEQNDYMIQKFQAADAIKEQLEHGCQYYFASDERRRIGFLAFYPRENAMYLSKLYLYKEERGKGYSRQMLDFVIRNARNVGLTFIELNVNRNNSAIYAYEKLGFKVIRAEKMILAQASLWTITSIAYKSDNEILKFQFIRSFIPAPSIPGPACRSF